MKGKSRFFRFLLGFVLFALLLSACSEVKIQELPEPEPPRWVELPAEEPTSQKETEPEPISEPEPATEPEPAPESEPVPDPELVPEAKPEAEEVPPAEKTDEPILDFVLNTNTKKYHVPTCSSVSDIKDKNKAFYTGTVSEVEAMGYVACKRCH